MTTERAFRWALQRFSRPREVTVWEIRDAVPEDAPVACEVDEAVAAPTT